MEKIGARELKDMEDLIMIFFPFAEELLIKYGEFHPFAGAFTTGGEFVAVGQHKAEDFDNPAAMIAELKLSVKQRKQDYAAAAVFYEVRTKDPETGNTAHAIAVFVEHINSESAYEFFYPFNLNGKEFTVEESYGNSAPKAMFMG